MYKSKLDQCAIAIEEAREKVAKAQQEYSRGGSVSALHRAERELADCHAEHRRVYGLRSPLPNR